MPDLLHNPAVSRSYLGEGDCNYCGQRTRVFSITVDTGTTWPYEVQGAFCSVLCADWYERQSERSAI